MESTKSNSGPVRIGFWRDPNDPRTKNLPDPRDSVEPTWDPVERLAVAEYLRRGRHDTPWQGHSWCRFRCGVADDEMGAWDMTDGEFLWPEGYAHYVEKHGVKPPEEFLAHVRDQLHRRAAEGEAKSGGQ